MSARQPLRVGFVMEQALGHVTYTRNLARAFQASKCIYPVWMPVPFASSDVLQRLPAVGANWTARGSMRAYAMARRAARERRVDALFFHTQTVALAAPVLARTIPVTLSLDATPLNYDSVGTFYGHNASHDSVAEKLKRALYRRVFRSAAALTTWSQWAKDSLCQDYGVASERVTVIPPGVDLELFPFGSIPRNSGTGRPVRILFVGGDFKRKGGPLLLEAMRAGLAHRCELHVVTTQDVSTEPGVHVYRDLGPNDPRLLDLYRSADIFALPTYADCLAVVLGEAMASGLPIVTTSVAAQPEAVQDGVSGIIVRAGDPDGLAGGLRRLAGDPDLRRRMGQQGRSIAERRFDARLNAERLGEVITSGIERWQCSRSDPASDGRRHE